MVKKIAYVKSKYGIHARPSVIIVTTAKKFPSTSIKIIDVEKSKECDAKSILELMMMTLSCGAKLIVSADGEDEEKAADTIVTIIETYEIEVK